MQRRVGVKIGGRHEIVIKSIKKGSTNAPGHDLKVAVDPRRGDLRAGVGHEDSVTEAVSIAHRKSAVLS